MLGKNLNLAVVLCSHTKSKRIPEKCFYKFENKPVIEHLLDRLRGFNVIVAVPKNDDVSKYSYLPEEYSNVELIAGVDDPLKRMADVVERFNIKTVIRICHDKIFVSDELIAKAYSEYLKKEVDYLYSSEFTEGSGFEIISGAKVIEASKKFKDCEYISYAIREITDNILNYTVTEIYKSGYRMLIDYPEDLALMHKMNMNFSLPQAIDYLFNNEKIAAINLLPKLTIYTCNYNGRKYLAECIRSVLRQRCFGDFEYIIIDDCSDDDSLEIINKTVGSTYQNIKILRNKKNIGLAASSNIALEHAKGKYVLRLDADDYFQYQDAAFTLLNYISKKGYDAVYCGNQFQRPEENHHIGGAIFNRKEMNFIKFSERLRGYEGYDFFLRAKDRIKIGYFYKPLWHYRQHPKSMSKTNLEERENLKKEIEVSNGI